MEERTDRLQACMYPYSRAIYRSIRDLVDPYGDTREQLEARQAVLGACEHTMERLARDPEYISRPDPTLFPDIRRHFPITAQAQVALAGRERVAAAIALVAEQLEARVLDRGA